MDQTPAATLDWTGELVDQLDRHWRSRLRPRLRTLSTHEYFWEPAEDCWSIRPRGTSQAPVQAGSGDFTIDFAVEEPSPPPVTTIAWRIGHLVVGVLGARGASHFGGPGHDYMTHAYAGTAAEALAQLDTVYATWLRGVRGLGPAELAAPAVTDDEEWAVRPMASLVLNITREVVHHGAEIALLRDLYADRDESDAHGPH